MSSPYLVPTTEQIRKNGNHLREESSAYLQQHAHNPMDWYPWNDEALHRARVEDKPIFLSVGYSSCHWCHVMEEQVFENDEIAAFMNEHYINIKVDREERPDLDAVYMEAVRAMTRGGGWPMSVFLTPDLKPFYGGTYFPAARFMQIASGLLQAWHTNRGQVLQQGQELYDIVAAGMSLQESAPLTVEEINTIVTETLKHVDYQNGGFQAMQKFPTPLRWSFLLHQYRRTGDPRIEQVVRLTLDKMGSGGIHDHVAGGFHRYTVDDDWTVPHFEKMLYDNAQLASLYIEASAVFNEPRYGEIARSILDFLLNDMSGPESEIYASYDADSGGVEGSFYVWSPEDIEAVVDEKDRAPLMDILGITSRGNFEGKTVLTWRIDIQQVAEKHDRSIEEIENLFDKWQPVMLEYRNQRTWPGLDRKIVTAWNGLALTAFSQGYSLIGEERYRKAAEAIASFLWKNHRNEDGSLVRASTDHVQSGNGILDDYAFFANGLLELFKATGDSIHFAKAQKLLEYVNRHFASEEGAFYLTPDTVDTPLGRQIEIFDSVEPSGNSSLLDALLKTAAISGNEAWREKVQETIERYSKVIQRAGLEMAQWLDVADHLHGPFHEIILAGNASDPVMQEFEEVLRDLQLSQAVVIRVNGDKPSPELVELIPPVNGKTALNGVATAYVCQYGSCQSPTNDPEQFKQAVLEGWCR